jgi:hypothetical protein
VPQFIARVCKDSHRTSTTVKAKSLDVVEVIVTMVILQGLNDRYETLRENLLLRADLTDIAGLRAFLIEQFARIDAKHTSSPAVAHAAQAGGGKAPECLHCHKRGHDVSTCYKKFPELRNKKLQVKLTKTRKEVKTRWN